jgi:hypothetical protein
MPSKSAKQHRFMEAAAHDPKFAAKADIPQAVASEFVNADRMKAGADKGRATQQHARGTMSSGKRAAEHAKANRALGHTFHSIKGKP